MQLKEITTVLLTASKNINVGMHLDVYNTNKFSPNILMLDTTKLCIVIVV